MSRFIHVAGVAVHYTDVDEQPLELPAPQRPMIAGASEDEQKAPGSANGSFSSPRVVGRAQMPSSDDASGALKQFVYLEAPPYTFDLELNMDKEMIYEGAEQLYGLYKQAYTDWRLQRRAYVALERWVCVLICDFVFLQLNRHHCLKSAK